MLQAGTCFPGVVFFLLMVLWWGQTYCASNSLELVQPLNAFGHDLTTFPKGSNARPLRREAKNKKYIYIYTLYYFFSPSFLFPGDLDGSLDISGNLGKSNNIWGSLAIPLKWFPMCSRILSWHKATLSNQRYMNINDEAWCSRHTAFLKTWKNGDLTTCLSVYIYRVKAEGSPEANYILFVWIWKPQPWAHIYIYMYIYVCIHIP